MTFCLFLCLVCSACTRSSDEYGLNPGDKAPPLTLTDLAGQPRELSDFKGKVVLLNFWATWCPPCMLEMPELQRLQEKLQKEDFTVVAVGVSDAAENLARAQRQMKLTFPILVDTTGVSKKRYKLTGFPETFILDKSGSLVLTIDPEMNQPNLRIIGPRSWAGESSVRILETLLSPQ